jgi:hypothetical protein
MRKKKIKKGDMLDDEICMGCCLHKVYCVCQKPKKEIKKNINK